MSRASFIDRLRVDRGAGARERAAVRPAGVWVATAVGLLGFVGATNRWMSWAAGFRLLLPHDEVDYRVIATAAPHLPGVRLPEQHAQRFPFHYVLGLVAQALGLSVPSAYRIAVIVLAVLLAALLAAVLATVDVSDEAFVLCLGVFVLNAYSLRYYVIAPGMMADLVFEAAFLVALLGLLRRSYALVMTGLVFATLARQSAVPASLGVAAWLWFGPVWRDASVQSRTMRAGAAILVSVGLLILEIRVAAPFSASTTPDFRRWTMLADLEQLPSGFGALAQHFLRAANGLFSVGALTLVTVAAIKRGRPHRSLPIEFWWTFALAALIAIQPVIFSPQYAAHNETRLTVLALPTLVCGLAILLTDLDHQERRLSGTVVLALTAALGVGSLHHLYTVIGTADAKQTVVLQAVVAACLALTLWRSIRPRLTAARLESPS